MEDLVCVYDGTRRAGPPLVEQGFIAVPDTPGLGFEGLDLDVLFGFLDPEEPGLFEPTDEWDREPVNDRLWS